MLTAARFLSLIEQMLSERSAVVIDSRYGYNGSDGSSI